MAYYQNLNQPGVQNVVDFWIVAPDYAYEINLCLLIDEYCNNFNGNN